MSAAESAAGLVRPAAPPDAQAIAAVHVATWRDAYAGLMTDAVLAGNHPARGFYEAQGWRADGTEKPWTYDGTGPPLTEVRYVRNLGSPDRNRGRG